MYRNNRLFLALTYLPFLLVSIYLLVMERRAETSQPTRDSAIYGRYSAQQILQMSETIGMALAPEAAELQFMSSPLEIQDREGRRCWRKWQVEITDREGNIKGTLRWDDESGRVEQASLPVFSGSQSPVRLTIGEAVRMSWWWMETLHIAAPQRWLLEGQPRLVRGQWQCRFLLPHARALVCIDASNGLLVFARTRPVSAQ